MRLVVLIYPKLEEIKKDKMDSEYGLPLSLLAISSKLINNYKVKIIDERVDEDYLNLIKESMKKNPVCVGISCMTGNQIFNAIKIAKEVRKINPQIPIVLGGWHPSVLPEETMESELIDIIIKGQGEEPFYELVEALSQNKDLKNINGIYFKKDGLIIKTNSRSLEDLNNYPPMPYELLDLKKYENRFKRINYVSSYGCPHRCGFCANSAVFKRKWFGLDAKRVVDELEFLIKKYGYKDVRFEDDNFFVDFNRVKKICEEILKRNLKFTWFALARASYIARLDDSFLNLIKRAGCIKLLIGTETGSQKVLDYINKDTKIEDTYSFIKKCKKHNIVGWHSIIVGFPNESKGVLKETFNLIKYIKKENRKNEILVFFYTPYPGTALFNECIKLGFKAPNSLEGWSKYNISNLTTPWVSKNYRNKVNNFLYYVNLAYLDSKTEETILKTNYKRFFYKFIKEISMIRLKINFYYFPIEIYLAKIIKLLLNKK